MGILVVVCAFFLCDLILLVWFGPKNLRNYHFQATALN